MISLMFILLFTCKLLSCTAAVTNETDDKLVFAQIIFRHGDRTIRTTYPNDPYKDKIHWPEGFAQLTNLGKQQEYELGKWIRRRYGKLLGDGSYSPDKVNAVSSELDRSINSAALVLAGLFPPDSSQVWNKDLLWQPIPVYIIPLKMDYFIVAENACARFRRVLEEYEKSPKIQEIYRENRALFQYLERHSGMPIRGIEQLKNLHATLEVEHLFNKTLPEWTKTVFLPDGRMQRLAEYWLKFTTDTTELKKLKYGFLLKEILERFQEKSLSSLDPDRSLWLYSGHDVTIGGILNTLGVFEEAHIPPYASCVLFEMYESNDDYHLEIYYRNAETDDLRPLDVPKCGTKCPLHQFFELYSDVLPTSDVESECKVNGD